ncbi:MAG: glycerophosphodiester phosphodiesterase [Elusimicrobia bacterium]|nr:glycerophosphodiester phosphodiesterase [Elusimicrobiota bacterium]
MRLIAHRGASGHAPENTMAAFRLALEMGASAIELDVHQTRDGELAVMHDWDLKRTGRNLPKGHPGRRWTRLGRSRVGDMTFKELSAADVGSWFGPAFRGERIPRLADVLALVAGKAELHVELKKGSGLYPCIEARVVELLRRSNALKWVVVSSFDHEALRNARLLEPRLRLGYLLGLTTMRRALRETAELRAESLNISLRQATPKRVSLARAQGLRVLVYTVDRPADALRLEGLGVYGVYSNHPELPLKAENR